MNDKIQGKANNAVGTLKQKAGQILNDKDLEARGDAQKAKGKGEEFLGNVKETLQSGARYTGDKIEKVGRKIKEKGFQKTGETVEKIGDTIEHVAD
jgi:uncharacterized protein YjbJ (UPF0337 family)